MAQPSTKPRKAQISYGPVLPGLLHPLPYPANPPQILTDTPTDLQPLPTPYYSRLSTKAPKGDSTKPVVVVVVHQPSGPVREAGTERPGYGGYYH